MEVISNPNTRVKLKKIEQVGLSDAFFIITIICEENVF